MGAPNSEPRVGPVVITELMYHPSGTHDSFLELTNISAAPVEMWETNNPQNTWTIGGIAYSFPPAIELAPGEIILVVPVDPTLFRQRYGIPAPTRIFGPYPGNLSNSGERIRLSRPDKPDLVDGIVVVPYIDVDSFAYSDSPPWPSQPDGNGPSLQRIFPSVYGDDPINWRSSATLGGSPGFGEEPPVASYAAWFGENQLAGAEAAPDADPDGDGVKNLLEYAFATDPSAASPLGLPILGSVSDQGSDYLTITYHRRIGALDIRYTPEFGPDLLSWPDPGTEETEISSPSANPLTEVITIRDPVPSGQTSRRFGRVRVDLE